MALKAGYILLLCSLAGCTMGPDYRPPSLAVPDHWQAEKNTGPNLKFATSEKLRTWWKGFGDPQLID